MAVAVTVSLMAKSWAAPAWLEPFGAWASILVLLLLGLVNLNALRETPPGDVVARVGLAQPPVLARARCLGTPRDHGRGRSLRVLLRHAQPSRVDGRDGAPLCAGCPP